MILAIRGRYRARHARDAAELARCQALRHLAFREARGLPALPGHRDADDFDPHFRHVVVEETGEGAARVALAACFRYRVVAPNELGLTYTGRFYDLHRLRAYPTPMVEMGRFCLHPEHRASAVICTAWSALLALMEAEGASLVFGCASFAGADPSRHAAALAHLARHHVGPARWRPGRRVPEAVPLSDLAAPTALCARRKTEDQAVAVRHLPPLLRAYLGLGGWVSDHAVPDRELDTLHVFIAVELARMPPRARRRLAPPGPPPAGATPRARLAPAVGA